MKFYCEGLAPEVVNRAQMELGETEEVRRKSLKELKNLIKAEKDFFPYTEDAFLLRFLRSRKFNVNKAFKKVQLFYKFKAENSRKATDFKPSELKEAMRKNIIFTLYDREENDAALAFVRVGKCDFDDVPPDEMLALGFNIFEFALLNETSQICGYSMIFDIGGLSIRNFRRIASPSFIYKLVHAVQDCIPARIKSIHVVNVPYFFNVFIKMAMFLASEKITKRVHIHSSLESLHKHLSPDILPEEYGGRQGPASEFARDLNNRLLSIDDHYEQMIKYGYRGKALQKLKK